DDVLRRHLERLLAQRDADDAIDRREDQKKPWSFRLRKQASQTEDDPALVFRKNLDRAEEVDGEKDDDDGQTDVHAANSIVIPNAVMTQPSPAHCASTAPASGHSPAGSTIN